MRTYEQLKKAQDEHLSDIVKISARLKTIAEMIYHARDAEWRVLATLLKEMEENNAQLLIEKNYYDAISWALTEDKPVGIPLSWESIAAADRIIIDGVVAKSRFLSMRPFSMNDFIRRTDYVVKRTPNDKAMGEDFVEIIYGKGV